MVLNNEDLATLRALDVTSRPWEPGVCRVMLRHCIVVAKAPPGKGKTVTVVAICGDAGADDEPESVANARLIAAAPDLLDTIAALKAVNAELDAAVTALCEERDWYHEQLDAVEAERDALKAYFVAARFENLDKLFANITEDTMRRLGSVVAATTRKVSAERDSYRELLDIEQGVVREKEAE